jgi:hypothetical protein
MADAWYEVLSVLHLMAMVCLLQANSLLLPRAYGDGYGPRVSDGKRSYKLNCILSHVLPSLGIKALVLANAHREQTCHCRRFLEGCWLLGLRNSTSTSTDTVRTKVCTFKQLTR